MDELLIDANVLVEYLKTKGGLLAQIRDHYKLFLSVVSVTELLASKKVAEPARRQELDELLKKQFTLIPVSPQIADKAAEIMRDQEISLADALISATAIDKSMPLVTYDISTFDLVPDLKLVDI